MSNKGERLVWADTLKGILIILVVLGHSIQASMIKLELSFTEDYLWNLIYSFHMPTFIAVSGFLVYRKNVIGVGKFNWLQFSWRRFRQLMIPYLIWSIALFFVNHNVEHYYDYLLYPQKSLWFLWALFFIAVIFAAVDLITQYLKVKQEISRAICWVLLVVLMFMMSDAKLLGVEYVAYYFFYYMVGYYLHKYYDRLKKLENLVIALLGILWFALGSIYSTQGLPKELQFIYVIPQSVLYMVYRMLTAVIAIFFLFSLAQKVFSHLEGVSKLIVCFGTVSLGIYAVHMVLRFRLVEGIQMVIPGLLYWPLMIITFSLLLTISYFLVWLLGKWSVTSFLLLGKLNK